MPVAGGGHVQKDAVSLKTRAEGCSLPQRFTKLEVGGKNRMEGRKLERRRTETGRNAVGERILPPQTQNYIGVCRPINVFH
jgi:hypothetical protein